MARPKEPLKSSVLKPKSLKGKRGQCSIKKERIIHTHLFSDIRKRLKIKSKDLPNYKIRKMITEIMQEINHWIVDNPEGFRMPNDMGVLAISKYILIPFREDRFEIMNRIKNMSEEALNERFRRNILRKYGKALTKIEAMHFMKKGKTTLVPMWFNQRNCSIRKARIFKWKKSGYLKNLLLTADRTKYYTFYYQDFFDYRIKQLDTYTE